MTYTLPRDAPPGAWIEQRYDGRRTYVYLRWRDKRGRKLYRRIA